MMGSYDHDAETSGSTRGREFKNSWADLTFTRILFSMTSSHSKFLLWLLGL